MEIPGRGLNRWASQLLKVKFLIMFSPQTLENAKAGFGQSRELGARRALEENPFHEVLFESELRGRTQEESLGKLLRDANSAPANQKRSTK